MRRFQALFDVMNDQDVRSTAKAAARSGYAVVPVQEGGKRPVCTLNTRELREQGTDHPCGVYHAISDPAVADKVFSRLGKGGARMNIGVVAGPSRLVVIDADTAAQVAAFQADWAAALGEVYADYSPTVSTPGMADDHGRMVHKDGGHYYFDLPEGVVLPWDVKGSMKHHGYDIRWGMCMTLVPPSVRPEGPYRTNTEMLPCPQWIIDLITGFLSKVVERRLARSALTADDSVAAWAVGTPWEALLEPHGWTDTGKLDDCGCGIWTKPGGGRTSHKSATAHEADCLRYDNIEGHGPLHLWTTEPPEELLPYVEAGTQTITKLQFAAAMEFGNSIAAAKTGLGIEPDMSDWFDGFGKNRDDPDGTSVRDRQDSTLTPDGPDDPRDRHVSQDSDSTTTPHESSSDDRDGLTARERISLREAVLKAMGQHGIEDGEETVGRGDTVKIVRRSDMFTNEAQHRLKDRIVTTAVSIYTGDVKIGSHESWLPADDFVEEFLGDATTIEHSVLRTTEGKFLFPAGRTNLISGPRGAGKTMLATLITNQAISDGKRVLYFDMEDRMGAFKERLTMGGCDVEPHVREGRLVYVNPGPLPVGSDLDLLVEYAGRFDVVVFDTMSRMISRKGGDVSSGNSEIVWLYDNVFDPIAGMGAAVFTLDHPSKRGLREDASFSDMEPGGGGKKMDNISGHAVALSPVKHFTRGDPVGHVRIVCMKDRTGHYAQKAVVGEFRSELGVAHSVGFELRVDPPGPEAQEPSLAEDLAAVTSRLLKVLREAPSSGATAGMLKPRITERLRPYLQIALDDLVTGGKVVLTEAGRYCVKPDDPDSGSGA